MASPRPQGRIDYDLWDFDVVDTVEGNHYRAIDLAGNYHGSFHNEAAAHKAVWDHNREVAVRQGRLYSGRFTDVLFILLDQKVIGRVNPGEMVPGKLVMNQGGDRIWVDDEWFGGLLVVNG